MKIKNLISITNCLAILLLSLYSTLSAEVIDKTCVWNSTPYYSPGTGHESDRLPVQFGDLCYMNSDSANSITLDQSGNIFTTGQTYSNLFSIQYRYTDGFLIKYNSNGIQQFGKQFSTMNHDLPEVVKIDSQNNIIIVGNYQNMSTAYASIFIRKFDSTGNELWKVYEHSVSDQFIVYDLELDQAGNIFITGSDYQCLENDSSKCQTVAFFNQYDQNGVKQWTQFFKDSTELNESTYSNSLTIDSDGNVYLTGYTNGDLLNPNAEYTMGNYMFISKLDIQSKTVSWVKQQPVSSQEGYTYPLKILFNSTNGYVTVVGETMYGFGAGDGNEPTDNLYYIFLADFDSNGNLLKSTYFSSNSNGDSIGSNRLENAIIDSIGNIYIVGSSYNDLFATNVKDLNGIILKIDTNGSITGQQIASNDNEPDILYSVTVNSSSDKVYVSGETSGDLYRTNPNGSTASADAFVAEINLDLNQCPVMGCIHLEWVQY